MIHDLEKGIGNHGAIIRLRKKMANEDMRERTHLRQTHRYYHSTRHPACTANSNERGSRVIGLSALTAGVSRELPLSWHSMSLQARSLSNPS